MGFRLVPKSVTLNDDERRNDRYLAFILRFFRRSRQLWGPITIGVTERLGALGHTDTRGPFTTSPVTLMSV